MSTVTITSEPQAAPPASAPGLRPYLMSVDVYERIAATGALGDDSPVFLWRGQLVEKVSDMTKGRPHVTVLNAADQALGDLVRPHGNFVEQDQPIELGDASMPEPDLKCVRGRNFDYASKTPKAADCPLVVEAADTSLAADRGVMLETYAAGQVEQYWILNITEKKIEVYTSPIRLDPDGRPGYAQRRDYSGDESVPVVLDGKDLGRIPVREIFP